MIKTKSKHTSTFIFQTSSDRRGVGETIRSNATGKIRHQAGKIKRWFSRSMISSFIQYTGRLPHAVRKMHRRCPSYNFMLVLNDPVHYLHPSPPPPFRSSVTHLRPLLARR
jgi:hypothetical protein